MCVGLLYFQRPLEMQAVFSFEKMNKVLYLNYYYALLERFDVNNSSLENKNLFIYKMQFEWLKVFLVLKHLKLIVQILALCKAFVQFRL